MSNTELDVLKRRFQEECKVINMSTTDIPEMSNGQSFPS